MRLNHQLPLSSAVALIVVALGFVPAASAAERMLVSFEARQWTAEPAGGVLLSGDSLVDTLDLQSDLALLDDDALEGRIVFRPTAKTLIRVGFVPELNLVGDNVVSRSIVFLGQTFGVQSRVVTDLSLEYGRLAFAWQGLALAENRFRLGPIIEVKGFRGDLSLSAPDLADPISEQEKFEAAFGSAGLILNYQIGDRLELFGESTVSVTGDEGDLTDTEYGVRYMPIPMVAIVAGMRTLDIDVADTNDRLDFELDGLFLGAAVSF